MSDTGKSSGASVETFEERPGLIRIGAVAIGVGSLSVWLTQLGITLAYHLSDSDVQLMLDRDFAGNFPMLLQAWVYDFLKHGYSWYYDGPGGFASYLVGVSITIAVAVILVRNVEGKTDGE